MVYFIWSVFAVITLIGSAFSDVKILVHEKHVQPEEAGYYHNIQYDNDVKDFVRATLKTINGQDVYGIHGFYQYNGLNVEYVADENGYRVTKLRFGTEIAQPPATLPTEPPKSPPQVPIERRPKPPEVSPAPPKVSPAPPEVSPTPPEIAIQLFPSVGAVSPAAIASLLGG